MWRQDDETQQMLRESAESFAASEHSAGRFRACRDSEEGFDTAFWRAMGELGWTGILVPEETGGAGLGIGPALTLADVFGQKLIPEPFVASAVVAATILASAEGALARELASGLAAGSAIIALATQEDPREPMSSMPSTRLVKTENGYLLSGKKVFAPAWTKQTTMLVTAVLDGDLAIAVVKPECLQSGVRPKKMSDGGVTADLDFNGLELGEDTVIARGAKALQALDLALARGILAIAAQLEGLSRALLTMTCDYVCQRVQFDQPLSHFQAVRHAIANLYTQVEMAGAAWRNAATKLEEGVSPECLALVSGAKARASETALTVAKAAIQYHGAFGYTEEADIGLYVNAALRWASWMGNASTHRALALDYHRKSQAAHA